MVDEVNIVDLVLIKETVQGENESSNDDDSPRSKKAKTSNVNC